MLKVSQIKVWLVERKVAFQPPVLDGSRFYQHTFSINQACRKNSNTGEGCKHQSLKFALEDMGTKIQDSVIYDEAHHET